MSSDTPVDYVLIAPSEDDDAECEEFQLESDNSLLLSTLKVQYVDARGLKYRNPETGSWRTLKIVDDRIFAPTDSDGWLNKKFIVAVARGDLCLDGSRKRNPTEEDTIEQPKNKKTQNGHVSSAPSVDLIILGLSYNDREDKVRDFFSRFGEIDTCEVKMSKDGQSRGFAFIRFKSRSVQRSVLLGGPYSISGRVINVKRADIKNREDECCRLFVTKLNADTSLDILRTYFTKYGKVVDVFIPRKNFKNFGFVTFEKPDSVYEALDDPEKHELENKNVVCISRATPRKSLDNEYLVHPQSNRGFENRHRYAPEGHVPSLLNPPMGNDNSFRHSNSQEQAIFEAVKIALANQSHREPHMDNRRYEQVPPEFDNFRPEFRRPSRRSL